MVTVHHLENSRSQRVLWLLEELGIDYDIKHYQRDKKTGLAPKALFDVHPLGKSPVIVNDELIIAESGLIIEYLIDTYGHGQLMPARGTPEHLQYRYWLHYSEGTFMNLMIITLVLNRIESAPQPFFIKPITRAIARKAKDGYSGPNIKLNLQYLEAVLQTSKWFCGSRMSGADIMMSFPIEAAAVRTDLTENYPALAEFHKRIKLLPAYQRAIERGGPYAY